MAFLLPDATAANLRTIPWLGPSLVTPAHEAIACIQAFLIESPEGKTLVDCGVGLERQAAIPTRIEHSGSLLRELLAADVRPEAIDRVIFTHLHFDHVGWASSAKRGGPLAPTFPRARYLLPRPEWEFWSARSDAQTRELMAQTLEPVFAAGQVELVAPDQYVARGLRLEHTPGHTPGHVSVHLESRGDHGVITGDLMHLPAQLARPEWWSTFDFDRAQAEATRRRFLERYAGTSSLIIGTHFAHPTAGHVVADGEAFRLAPV